MTTVIDWIFRAMFTLIKNWRCQTFFIFNLTSDLFHLEIHVGYFMLLNFSDYHSSPYLWNFIQLVTQSPSYNLNESLFWVRSKNWKKLFYVVPKNCEKNLKIFTHTKMLVATNQLKNISETKKKNKIRNLHSPSPFLQSKLDIP